MNEINIRIRRIILFEELTYGEFARKLNISKSNLNQQLNSKNPNIHLLETIEKLYTDINMNWIKTGEESPFKCSNDLKVEEHEKQIKELTKALTSQTELIVGLIKRLGITDMPEIRDFRIIKKAGR